MVNLCDDKQRTNSLPPIELCNEIAFQKAKRMICKQSLSHFTLADCEILFQYGITSYCKNGSLVGFGFNQV